MQNKFKIMAFLVVLLSFALGITVSRIHQQSEMIGALRAKTYFAPQTKVNFTPSIQIEMEHLRAELRELEAIKEEQLTDLQKEMESIREDILDDLSEIRIELR